MSKLDKVKFKLSNRPTERNDDINPIPKNIKFINDRSPYGLKAKINIFDADYLNQVNSKRLDDLQTIDYKNEFSKDKLAEYLDRESSA